MTEGPLLMTPELFLQFKVSSEYLQAYLQNLVGIFVHLDIPVFLWVTLLEYRM